MSTFVMSVPVTMGVYMPSSTLRCCVSPVGSVSTPRSSAVSYTHLADKRAAQACRGKVGLVFQYPEYQLFAATVREDVAFGPRNLGLPADEVDRRVEAALESVRLDIVELGDKSPFELSGGQQRRVAFAGVLAMEPRILVLDEPVAGLDPVAREEFLDLIAQLHAGGLTVVMVSHSMDDLARLSDRVLVLNEGRQFAFGSPAEVFAHGDELRAIGPVSYTHLDVYKRQASPRTRRSCWSTLRCARRRTCARSGRGPRRRRASSARLRARLEPGTPSGTEIRPK